MAESQSARTAMTLRVYRLNGDREVTYDSGTRDFSIDPENGTATSPVSVTAGGFPPCSCPKCRRPRR